MFHFLFYQDPVFYQFLRGRRSKFLCYENQWKAQITQRGGGGYNGQSAGPRKNPTPLTTFNFHAPVLLLRSGKKGKVT